jgi:DNA polymerase III subunit epsilon
VSSKEMKLSQLVESIEAISTQGELGALLKESYLVKKLQPIYNRQLRIARKVILVRNMTNGKGYHEISLETADTIYATDAENILGVFKSLRQAKAFLVSLVKDYSLCEKLLTLQKTKSSCFAYQLGYCKGACIEKENPLRYNMRFIEAFSKNKIKTWPFSGPIVITERDEEKESSESFLIDKWCVLDNTRTGVFDSSVSIDADYAFDVDTYKILVQYLRHRKNHKNIRTFSSQHNFMSRDSSHKTLT